MRAKDILWITSLLGLIYLHTMAQEKPEKIRDISLKVVVDDGDKHKVIDRKYNSYAALRSDSIWSKYDIELDLPVHPHSADISVQHQAFNTCIRISADSTTTDKDSWRKKVIIKKSDDLAMSRKGDSAEDSIGSGEDRNCFSDVRGYTLKFEMEDSTHSPDKKRTIEIVIHSEKTEQTK